MIRQDEKECYTYHERSGQYEFTHSSGCPSGLRHSASLRSATALGTSLGVSKPILSLPLVGGIYQTYIMLDHTLLYPWLK